MDNPDERAVAAGLRRGRPDAWQSLYDAHAARVWRFVARRLPPDPADVADVVQETFLAAAKSAASYDAARGSLAEWLSGIARRHVALYYRRRDRHDHVRRAGERLAGHPSLRRWVEGTEPPPDDAAEAAELALLVRAALAELPSEYERVLAARYFDAREPMDMAADEGCTAEAVRAKLHRARQAFRRAFLSLCGEPEREATHEPAG